MENKKISNEKENKCKRVIEELHTHQAELKMQNEELRQAQISLQESRNRYSDLYDFAPISYFIFDKMGVIRQLNLTACAKLNNDRASLLGAPFVLFVPVQFRDTFYFHIREVINTKLKQECELQIVPRTQSEIKEKPIDVQLSSIIQQDKQNTFNQEPIDVQLSSIIQQNKQNSNPEPIIQTVMMDVTELKKRDRELRKVESELLYKSKIEELKNFYENIVETIQEGLWKIDLEGKISYVNEQLSDMLGYTVNEMIGKSIFDFVDKDCVEFLHSRFERRKKGIKEKYECQFIKKNGTRIWVTVSTSPIFENSNVIGAIGLLIDITEKKDAENRIKESEQKYRTMVEYGSDMVWVEDKDGKFTFTNKQAEKLSGYTSSEILGRHFEEFMTKEEAQIVKEKFNQVMLGRAVEYETKFTNKFGKIITIAVNMAPIYIKGRVVGTTSFGRDITEQKISEEKIKEFTDKLKKSNEELEQFAYIASHDLQEPLRTVSSYTELISNRYKGRLDSEADEFIDYILTGTNNMQNMIYDLLELSRVSSRGKPFILTDINDILSTVLKNLHELIEKNSAIILIDKMPTIYADPSQMIQIFQNLIDNAIKFRKPNEIPQIHIKAVYQKEEAWIFSVQDNGIGIDPKDFKKLFIIFHRLHSRESYPGSGMGLAICKKIVERHGGNIWVESSPGEGSTFLFTIPKL